MGRPDDDGAPRVRRTLYGRRRGKPMRPARRAAFDRLLPELRVDLDGVAPGGLAPSTMFEPAPRAVWLEIGTGNGEHLAWQAAANPAVGLIAAEPYLAGVGRAIGHLDADGLSNVRFFVDDARLLLEALAEASVSRMFILFPDPWPKARHHKRRIVAPSTLPAIQRVLADGAELRLATDDMDYCRWMLALLTGAPAFEWRARHPNDWRRRTGDWPATRYEEKAIEQGRRPAYLRFRRRPRVGEGA